MTAWDFPGGAAGIAAAGLLLLAAVILSYRFGRRTIHGGLETVLVFLRLAALGVLLYALANPRLERDRVIKETRSRKLAILADTSGSMSKKGFWKRSRLDDAKRYLHENFSRLPDNVTLETCHFDAEGKAAPGEWQETAAETDLFGLLARETERQEGEKFDGVLYLTDGVDTAGREEFDRAFAALAASGMQHFFIPMTAELESPPTLELRKIECPTLAYAETEVPLSFMVRRSNLPPNARASLRVYADDRLWREFPLTTGTGLQTVGARFAVKGTGETRFRLETQVNGRTLAEESWSLTRQLRKNTSRILLYNGALEYGNRFLRQVFTGEAGAKLDIVFAPGVLREGAQPEAVAFGTKEELDKYDVIVLLNLNRKQMSEPMEASLRAYVEGGGGLLFITGNPAIAAEFAGSPLEKLLPVVFSKQLERAKRYDVRTAGIARLITSGGRKPTDYDSVLQRNSEMRYKEHPLKEFDLTDTARESPIFRHPLPDGAHRLIRPRFEDLALIESVKPGANVLATARDDKKKEYVLMAYQNFGSGRTLVLATDPLWRWKLKMASDDHSFELFWKNLLSWLALGRTGDAAWILPNRLAQAGVPVEVRFRPAEYADLREKLVFMRHGPEGATQLILPAEGAAELEFSKPGEYRLTAELEGKIIAETVFQVNARERKSREETALEPDLATLKRFATLPNVEVLDAAEPFDLDKHFPPESLEIKEHEELPLWHRPWLFGLAAGLAVLEWLLRRKYGALL